MTTTSRKQTINSCNFSDNKDIDLSLVNWCENMQDIIDGNFGDNQALNQSLVNWCKDLNIEDTLVYKLFQEGKIELYRYVDHMVWSNHFCEGKSAPIVKQIYQNGIGKASIWELIYLILEDKRLETRYYDQLDYPRGVDSLIAAH